MPEAAHPEQNVPNRLTINCGRFGKFIATLSPFFKPFSTRHLAKLLTNFSASLNVAREP